MKHLPNGDPLLIIEKLTVAVPCFLPWQKKIILDDFSCIIKPGTITGIIGKNGCGKTTLLNAIAGLIPYKGSVLFHYPTTGFILEHCTPPASMAIHEWMILAAQLHNLCANDYLPKIAKILETLHLTEYHSSLIGALSKGTLKRLLAAQAIIHEPTLLIADEPFAGLDAPSIELLKNLFLSYQQNNKTVVITGHIPDTLYTTTISLG